VGAVAGSSAAEGDGERFRAALLHAPFPVMIYAQDGQVVDVNDVWVELSGYSLQDTPTLALWYAKAQSDIQPVSAEDLAALFESDQRVEEGEQVVSTRYGGRLVWDFTSAPLGRLPDGRLSVVRMAADVTERKQLETSLWDANRRMQNIVESISDGFVALDREWRIVYVNRCAEQLIGQQRQDLLGQVIWDAYPAAQEMGLRSRAQRAAEENTTVHLETHDASSGRWLEFHIYPSPDGVNLCFRNVTGRVKLAASLRQTNEQLQALIRASPLGIIAMDENGDVTLWSPACEKMFGWKEQEVLGQPLPTVPPEQRATSHSPRAPDPYQTPTYFEAQRLTRDGRRIDVCVWASPLIGADGKPAGAVGFTADITQRKRIADALYRSNQSLQGLIRAAPLAIAMLDLAYNVVLWNPAAQRLFGWAEGEVLGRRLPIVPPDRGEQFAANIARIISGEAVTNQRVPCVRKDGSPILVNLSIAAVQDAAGVAVSLLGIMSPCAEP